MSTALQSSPSSFVDALQSVDPAWYQAGSTVVLVLVTLYYSRILKNEAIRDRRQDHTNELRETVTSWLNNLPAEDMSENHIDSLILTDRFQPIPESVSNDPYIDDFIDNHASDVEKLIENIKTEIKNIESIRSNFFSEFEDISRNSVPDGVEMADNVKPVELVFYSTVATKRLQSRKNESVSGVDGIRQCVDDVSDSHITHGNVLWIAGYTSHYTDSDEHGTVFSVPYDSRDYPPDVQNDQIAKAIASEKIDEFGNSINDIPDCGSEDVHRTVSSLSALEDDINDLRGQLKRYRRQNIYSGYCSYITDSTIRLLLEKILFGPIRRYLL